ncbi:MAG: allantoinase AllB [Candidatus Tectomicrobia bacterium]|nr:allantoinase AllB [Candidatus Tectomicrobia bacterium]
MTVDLAIVNGTVVTPAGPQPLTVAVRQERIVALSDRAHCPAAREILDASDLHVLPGLVEGHVHFREPGLTQKEDFGSGSAAAVCGGVTTVIDMPNTVPPTADAQSLRQKQALAEAKSLVDFGLLGVILPNNLRQLRGLVEAGALGLKVFMGMTVGNLPAPEDGDILEAWRLAAELGIPVAVHAESSVLVHHCTERLRAGGRSDALAHYEARPEIAEEEAIQRAILLAAAAGARLHVLHVSTAQGAALVGAAKRRGGAVSAETTPHYLLLQSADAARLGNTMKINPPVRAAGHAEQLWQALRGGAIDSIATDHAPHLPEEKRRRNVWEAPSGFPGVETALPLMLTQVNAGRMRLEEYVRWHCENPARIWGLYPRKGVIQVGSDADLTLVDLSRRDVIRAANLHSKSKVTPYEGWEVQGVPVCTLVRGQIVMREGQLVGRPRGRMLWPSREARAGRASDDAARLA